MLPARAISSLLLVVLSLCAARAWSADASIEQKLKQHLIGCKNDQVCCTPCVVGSCPAVPVCVGDPSAPQRDLGKCESVTSTVAMNLRYRHTAYDYRSPIAGGKGCASCGGGGISGEASQQLPAVQLQRNFYADTDLISSLGTHWGFNWDIWIHAYPLGTDVPGRPTGVPGWQVQISQPMAQPIDFFVGVDGSHTGNFQDRKPGYFPGLRFYDADGNLLIDPTASTRAVLTTWDGQRFEFEMYDEAPGVHLGRLTAYVDRNGNAVRSLWKYAVDDPSITGSLRLKLRIRDQLVDAYGIALRFTYDEDQLVQGTYVVTRIDLPNGGAIRYRYGTIANVWYGTDQALIGIDHPDGSTSSFSAAIDPSISCLRMEFIDPVADEPTSRDVSVWLSASPWINPDNPRDQYGQIFGRARKIENRAGELVFASAEDSATSLDPDYPGSEDRTYFYNQGRVTAVVHHNGDEVTARYQRNADGGPLFSFTTDWSGWTKIQGFKPDVGKLGDKEIVDGVGNVIEYVRDPASDRVLSALHPDGTSESYTYNEFQEVLHQVDRLGRVSDYTYDAAGNLLTKTLAVGTPDQGTWTYAYWSSADTDPERGKPGQLRSATDADGHATDYFYFPEGFLKRIREAADLPGGARSERSFTWDAAGRMASSSDGAGRVTAFDYDTENRQVGASYLDGSHEEWTYAHGGPDAGLLVASLDRNGNLTTYAYDSFGRLSAQAVGAGTPEAGLESWTYLPGNKTLVATHVTLGDVEAFAYDERLRVVGQVRLPNTATTLVWSAAYDNADRQTRSTDPYGRATYSVYDSDYRRIRMVVELVPGAVDPALVGTLPRIGGANPPYVIEETSYDAEGQVLARIDGRGIVTSYGYDGQGRIARRTEAEGMPEAGTWSRVSDPQGNLIRETDPRGLVNAMTYGGRNLVAAKTEAFGTMDAAITLTTYTPTGKPATVTDPLGHVTTFLYCDCCDRLEQIVDPLGFIVATIDYDPVGNRTSLTDANGDAQTTAYDHRNRPVAITDGEGEITRFTYLDDATVLPEAVGLHLGAGADGSAMVAIDAEGERSVEIRDGLGRPVRRVDALGHAWSSAYDEVVAVGAVLLDQATVTDPLGDVVRTESDGAGHVRARYDQIGELSTAAYDADGNLVSARDPDGVGQDCDFDARNRRRFCVDTAGSTHEWRYDADSNVIADIDALGDSETAVYDARNRKVSKTDRVLSETRYRFDADNNLIDVMDSEGGHTEFRYDARNLLNFETYPHGQVGRTRHEYVYDAGRRLIRRTVRAVNLVGIPFGPGESTGYDYDHADRMIRRRYDDHRDDSYQYDHVGRLLRGETARYANRLDRGFDAAGRLTSETFAYTSGPDTGLPLTVGYRYDDDNRLVAQTYPDGQVVARDWTARSELARVRQGADLIAERTYGHGMRLTHSALGNGLHEDRSYAAGDDLVSTISVPGATGFAFAYDALKRVTSESDAVDPDSSQTFGYDAQSRLTSWERHAAGPLPLPPVPEPTTQAWNLSSVGDWRSTTIDGVTQLRRHSAAHEVVRVDGDPLRYDFKGNLVLDEQGQRFAWDPENQLRSGDDLSQGAGHHVEYAYDALSRRVGKVVDGKPTTFVYAGMQVVMEIAGDLAAAPWFGGASDPEPDGAFAGARGSLLGDPAAIRIIFQPAASATPAGWLRDTGAAFGLREDGHRYGWTPLFFLLDPRPLDRDRLGRPLYDTLEHLTSFLVLPNRWSLALPNGTYPLAIICGDALSRVQTNHLQVNAVALRDPTPWDGRLTNGYETGSFDAFTAEVPVSDGRLRVEPGAGALFPKVCFLEIGSAGTHIDAATAARATAAAAEATRQTGLPRPKRAPRVSSFVYGAYVDETLAITTGGARYFLHGNRLSSTAALTDAGGVVVERYRYDAYGHRTVLSGDGLATRPASAFANQVGFTGRYHDPETGQIYFRTRYLSPSLGRFTGRDTAGYVDGMSLYAAYFVPNAFDPLGMDFVQSAGNCRTRQIDISLKAIKDIKSGWVTVGAVFGVPVQMQTVVSVYFRVTGSVEECECCDKAGKKGTVTKGQVTLSASGKFDLEVGARGAFLKYFEIFLGGFVTATGSYQGSGSISWDQCKKECCLKGSVQGQSQLEGGVRLRVTGDFGAAKVQGVGQAGVRGVADLGADLKCCGPTCNLDLGVNFKGGFFAQYNISASLWAWSVAYQDSASIMWETGRMPVHLKFGNPIPCKF
jgi:RHS repeat-associated protein